jgi:nitrite reductase/ring-hydroxylating ferredoxin subunit
MSNASAGLIKPEGRRSSVASPKYKSAIDVESGAFVSSYKVEKIARRRQQARERVATWVMRIAGGAAFLVALEYGSKYLFGNFHLRL